MQSIKFIKAHLLEIIFFVLVLVCLYIYFVVYLTTSRTVWYDVMWQQLHVFVNGITP
jgi:uncharacterized membrane protein (DUF373 family)